MSANFVVLYVPDWTQFLATLCVIVLLLLTLRDYRRARKLVRELLRAAGHDV